MLFKSKINLIYSPTSQYLLYSKTLVRVRETGIEETSKTPLSFELTLNLEQYYSNKFQIKIPELLLNTEDKAPKLKKEITERNVKRTENEKSINQLKENEYYFIGKTPKSREENFDLRTHYQNHLNPKN